MPINRHALMALPWDIASSRDDSGTEIIDSDFTGHSALGDL